MLAAPPRVAEKRGRRLVLVFDEFQQILSYEDDHVERALRSAVQQYDNVATFFLGSRKHLIERMFSDSRRPLYRSAGHYPLAPIATDHWVPFVAERFSVADKPIESRHVESLCALTEGHPFYTQHLAHALWERTPHGESVADAALDDALDRLALLDERQAQIVDLRYFVGLTVPETAEVLDLSPATVKRDWSAARAWLVREMQRAEDEGASA